jgi:hypothetical protein
LLNMKTTSLCPQHWFIPAVLLQTRLNSQSSVAHWSCPSRLTKQLSQPSPMTTLCPQLSTVQFREHSHLLAGSTLAQRHPSFFSCGLCDRSYIKHRLHAV